MLRQHIVCERAMGTSLHCMHLACMFNWFVPPRPRSHTRESRMNMAHGAKENWTTLTVI